VPPTPEQTNNRTNDLITNNDVMRDVTNRLGAQYSSSQTNQLPLDSLAKQITTECSTTGIFLSML
jgi:hypothetical protein